MAKKGESRPLGLQRAMEAVTPRRIGWFALMRRRVGHTAHRCEHVVHLAYFGALYAHFDYKTVALGCLIVGALSMLQGVNDA